VEEVDKDARLLCVGESVWLRLSGTLLLLPRHASGKTEKSAVSARMESRGILVKLRMISR